MRSSINRSKALPGVPHKHHLHTHQLCLPAVQESDHLQEPQPTSPMTPRPSQAKQIEAPTPASTPVAGATSRFQMGHSEKTADPAVGQQEDAALGGAPDKPLTSAFAGAASIESAPDSERTSLSGGPAGSGMESRWVSQGVWACGAAQPLPSREAGAGGVVCGRHGAGVP